MANLIEALFTTEGGRRKPLDARTHGIIDYCHSAFYITLSLLCLKSNRKTAYTAAGTGAFILVQSLLTDYPLGNNRDPICAAWCTRHQLRSGFIRFTPFMRLLAFQGSCHLSVECSR